MADAKKDTKLAGVRTLKSDMERLHGGDKKKTPKPKPKPKKAAPSLRPKKVAEETSRSAADWLSNGDAPAPKSTHEKSTAKAEHETEDILQLDKTTINESEIDPGMRDSLEEGMMIRDKKKRRFRLLPAMMEATKDWAGDAIEDIEKLRQPENPVAPASTRAATIKKAASLSKRVPGKDYELVAEKLKDNERTRVQSEIVIKKRAPLKAKNASWKVPTESFRKTHSKQKGPSASGYLDLNDDVSDDSNTPSAKEKLAAPVVIDLPPPPSASKLIPVGAAPKEKIKPDTKAPEALTPPQPETPPIPKEETVKTKAPEPAETKPKKMPVVPKSKHEAEDAVLEATVPSPKLEPDEALAPAPEKVTPAPEPEVDIEPTLEEPDEAPAAGASVAPIDLPGREPDGPNAEDFLTEYEGIAQPRRTNVSLRQARNQMPMALTAVTVLAALAIGFIAAWMLIFDSNFGSEPNIAAVQYGNYDLPVVTVAYEPDTVAMRDALRSVRDEEGGIRVIHFINSDGEMILPETVVTTIFADENAATFVRSIDSVTFGVSETGQLFTIFHGRNFDTMFADLLAWEDTLTQTLFTPYSSTTEAEFIDVGLTDLNDQNVRILKNDIGTETIAYTFVNTDDVIMAGNRGVITAIEPIITLEP